MGSISQVLARFGSVTERQGVMRALEADCAELAGLWAEHSTQFTVFDIAAIEKIEPMDALRSLGMAMAVESDQVDTLLAYIESPGSGFMDPENSNKLDSRMLGAVSSGFVEARRYGFKSLLRPPIFDSYSPDDLDSSAYEVLQRTHSDYDTHINRHLPVPRLYSKGKSIGQFQLRNPAIYHAIFDAQICQTEQQVMDLAYGKDYDALEKLATYSETPDLIKGCIRGHMQTFDYLATIDARRSILGSAEMSMTESRTRLEAMFRHMGSNGGSLDSSRLMATCSAFEFSEAFTLQGMQHTVDGILAEYSRKPVSLDDPASPELYSRVFECLAKSGLQIDATAIMAKERIDFCKAKDFKDQSGTLLPRLIRGLGAPSNAMVKGALIAAVREHPLDEILEHCKNGNDRLLNTLYQVTGSKTLLERMGGAGRDRVISADLGL